MKDIVRHKESKTWARARWSGCQTRGSTPRHTQLHYNKAWVHFIKDQNKLWVDWSSLKIITAQAAAKRVADREQERPPPRSLPPLRTVLASKTPLTLPAWGDLSGTYPKPDREVSHAAHLNQKITPTIVSLTPCPHTWLADQEPRMVQ